MSRPEKIPTIHEKPFEAKQVAFLEAARVLINEPGDEGHWKTEPELNRDRLQKAAKIFYGALIALKEEGRWDSLDEALNEDTGIDVEVLLGYSVGDSENIRTIFSSWKSLLNLLESLGITEEVLRGQTAPEPRRVRMAGIEEVPRPSPEISLGSEEARVLNEAAGRLVGLIDFASDPAADQWRAGVRPEETKEAGGDFLKEVLALRGWRTVKEALDEQSGIRFTEDNRVNRLRVQRLTDFLGRQGITEEMLRESIASEPTTVEPGEGSVGAREEVTTPPEELTPERALEITRRETVDACFWTGVFAHNRGHHQEALSYYNQAIEIEPHHLEAHLQRGRTYFILDQFQEALVDFNRAIDELGAENFSAYFWRGMAQIELGKVPQAIGDLSRAIEIEPNPGHGVAYELRAAIYGKIKQYTQALLDLDRAIEIGPENVGMLFQRGLIHHRLGHYRQAVADYTRALAINPDKKEIYLQRGITYDSLGRGDLAVADFARAAGRTLPVVTFPLTSRPPYLT